MEPNTGEGGGNFGRYGPLRKSTVVERPRNENGKRRKIPVNANVTVVGY